ncbi:MAG: glycosyl transferase, partial [Roseimicrobium sp.]
MQDRNITHTPDGRWLSNGRYFAFISASGTGQSRLHSYVANRWHGDPVEDAHGQFIYLRDKATGRTWSAAMQPTKHLGERYHAFGSLGTYSIHHVREGIASELEIAVSPTADAEARRLCLHNRSNQTRVIEITSYLEVALNYQGADTGHPAFSKLFVQTTGARELSAVFAERRPRAHDETWPCMFHAMVGAQALEFETDRLRFLGRRRTAFNPAVFDAFDALSGTSGNVLDPCFALRTVVELTAGESTSLTLLTGFGTDRAAALDLVTQLQAPGAVDAIFIEAHNAEITLQSKLSITELEATTFQQHACAVCYGTRSIPRTLHGSLLSPREETVFAALGIPRDRPIIVVKGGWLDQGAIVARKLRDYWASKGLFTNLILLTDNEEAHPAGVDDRVFTVHSSHVDEAGMTMLLLGASLVVDGALPPVKTHSAPQPPPCLQECAIEQSMERKTTALSYYNGYGAFDNEAKEYVIYIKRLGASYRRPPMPWINVIANEGAGFLVSDSGASCTWFRNSQANRMTPWSNDPVSDPYGEALYLRDEDTGLVWSPTPGPVAGGDCEVRHGLGYTTFISDYSKLKAIVTMFVDRHDPVKIVWLRLTNEDARSRRVSLTAYQRLVLGSLAESPSLIATERCGDGSLRARNLAGGSFCDGEFFASLAVHGIPTDSASFTCDRLSFLGRYGTAKSPLSLVLGSKLDETAGVGLDPCFAQQVSFEIPSGATVHCVLVMGEGISKVAANTLVSRYAALDVVSSSLEAARDYWRYLVGGIHLETPSAMMNAMVNTWLPYQTLSCRIWGRTA